MYAQKFNYRSFINCIVAFTDIGEISRTNITDIFYYKRTACTCIFSALMLILFDFSHLARHFSSLFLSSTESITLSSGIHKLKACYHPRKECID